ncbi:hypothetical protein RU639_001586 [Aspergillus parasiticus]
MGVGGLLFQGLGATKYTGPMASTKESDLAWINDLLKPGGWAFRKIEFEKHVLMQVMGLPTRLRPGTEYKPRKVATMKIKQGVNPPTVRGMALRLEVEKVIGRALNPPLEQDIVFTSAELLEWARYVFV